MPATVMSGEVGTTTRCASSSDSPSHFIRTMPRWRSNQPSSCSRSSAVRDGLVLVAGMAPTVAPEASVGNGIRTHPDPA